ncbi:hypothetical protein PQJ75_14615 [Rhodoplanes sp. TEM]|uniref:Uncharacterized protein n=1 Tax=Rhodoplanes tepidamans TaxID=200616 RepID=A0ABT5JD53_RHOTP|nr:MULTISPECIES: hypothetical protein [Rhodoplanes]MDC7787541.1 hypothetical protein [Rhodoplanes tepidamans]MDC7984966.1 hypothetical protein [Rhodoplanes sp. TEM]MDQ0357970.1 hypothetical protein [Rhodoplanes tepidamans]
MPDSAAVRAILERGAITAADVLALRQRVFWKGVVTAADAEMVFRLNDRLGPTADPGFAPFFVEALVDYLVNQAEPHGYVSEANADWLIARIAHSGRVDTASELELLVRVLEKAQSSPVRLVAFAIEQVERGVLTGEGPVGRGHRLRPGVIDAAEVELLRRILYAFGGDGNIAITRREAELLFDINDATAEAENHPAWSDLFAKAITSFLMAGAGYTVPTRQEALRRAAWLDAPTPGVGAFMGRMLTGGLEAVWDAIEHGTLDGAPRRGGESFALDDPPPAASDDDVRWAAARIGRRGSLHENEVALINFLKSRGAHLHRRLLPILDRVAA